MHALSRIYRSTLAFKARLFTTMLALPAITVLAFASPPVAHAQPDITIPTVLINKANNHADGTNYGHNDTNQVGYGKVDYNYRIGTTEVTNAQYALFLNSVAKADPNGLYNEYMDSDVSGGITRAGGSGSFKYTVKQGFETKPVNFVSFYDAARFCNWLTNGANSTASTETGMYTLTDDATLTRNADAFSNGGWAITSENEWYKAAYYNLATETYTTYATGNTIDRSQANYNNSTEPYVTNAGSYKAEQNDTYDMMGNVWEWNEAIISYDYPSLRGGGYANVADSLESSSRSYGYFSPSDEYGTIGFRVSSLTAIPEPSTYGILGGAAALLGAVALRRRNRRD